MLERLAVVEHVSHSDPHYSSITMPHMLPQFHLRRHIGRKEGQQDDARRQRPAQEAGVSRAGAGLAAGSPLCRPGRSRLPQPGRFPVL